MKHLVPATFKGNGEVLVDVRLIYRLGGYLNGGQLYLHFTKPTSIKGLWQIALHLKDEHSYKLTLGKIKSATEMVYVIDVVDMSPLRNVDTEGWFALQ